MQNHPIRVLLTDDDEDDFIVVRDLLSDLSPIEFDLEWVSDYGAALDAILSGEFDVCLLDYRLKERNGLELMQEALSRGAMTPIVFLTGHGGYDLNLEIMSKGAADWLTKGELSATLLERSIRQAMERQRKRDELIKAKRVIQALSECNHAVIHIKDELELLREICHIVVEVGGYRMAWVGYAEENLDQTVTPVARYGYEKEYLETVRVTWQDAERGKGPTGTCIRTGFPCIIRSVGNQAEFAPWQAEALKRGYASVIGLPLLLDGPRLGALTIYSSERDAFDTEEVEFLVKLSGNLSYGIGVLRLRKAQMQAQESLKEANLDLEKRVDERTAELVKVNAELRKEVEERSQAEDALRLSETRLSRAEVVARFGNWELILGRDKVKASEGARIIYGLGGSEWSIPEIQRIPLPEHRGMLDMALKGLIEEGKPYNVEFKIRRPTDGKIVDIHSIAEYSPEKGVVFGVIKDITEHKQMEKALLANEELLRTLINSTPDIVCFKDGEGRWLEANEAELELFELKGADYKGKKDAELAEVSKFYREALLASETADERTWRKHAPTRGEEIIPRPNGTAMVYEVIKVPLFHPDGTRKGLVVLGRDITERKRIEEEMRVKELKYRTLFETANDGIFLLGTTGYVDCNQKGASMYGLAREDVIARSPTELSPERQPDGRLSSEVAAEKILAAFNGQPQAFEWQSLRVDGVPFDVEITLNRIEVGGSVLLQAIVRDITDRKRAEDALRRSQRQLADIIEFFPDATFVINNEGTVIAWNRAMEQMTGISKNKMIGKGDFEYSLPFYGSRRPLLIDLLFASEAKRTEYYDSVSTVGDAIVAESYVPETNGGKGAYLWGVASALFDEQGNVAGAIESLRDVTERKLAEDALRESEERFSRFFRASPVGTSISRMGDGQFADANDAFLRLFGYTREELIGHNPLELGMWVNPESRAKMVETLQERGRIQGSVTQFVRKSGEIIDVLGFAEAIEMGGEQYVLNLAYDITERRRGAEERKKLEEQLFQAQKMESVGRLAGGVAHDFNNMLSVIIGRAELALNTEVSADQLQHNLKEILNAGLRSADLTRQLLAFARKQTAVPKVLDLNATISGMLKMLRRLIGEDIDLFWLPELDLWQVKIDPSQVDQILANLVVNARDAISGVGAITLRTDNVVIDESYRVETPEFIPGEYVLVIVSDTGAGMSQEVRENIFEPFFTTKEVGKGTGLGLSTVYGIVKQNDGFIYVASEPGKGTTFKIYLPRFEIETSQVPSAEAAGKRPTGTETILLVEDDEAILNLGKMILENLGYKVLAAQTPVDALRLAEVHTGDLHLLVTDVVMPEMNGRELAEQLSVIRPNLKCLYMSGYTADVIAHRGILDEGLNFIQKPFGSDDLAARVRQVLDHLE